MTISAEVDLRTLHEIHLYAFERWLKKPALDGYGCLQPHQRRARHGKQLLAYHHLKNEWGYEGCVVSD